MPKSVQYINIPVIDNVNYVISPTDNTLYYYITGTANLTTNWAITVGAGATAGMRCHFQYKGNVTLGGNHIFLVGTQIPDVLAAQEWEAFSFFNGTSWETRFFPDFEGTGIIETNDIADDAVTNDKLANMVRGTVKVGGVANAPTDLVASVSGRLLIGNGTDISSTAMSGDATITGAGVLTITADSVDNTKLANMTRGTVKVGGVANAPTDLTASAAGNILIGNGTDIVSVPVTGDITITGAGVVTVLANGPWEAGAGIASAQTRFATTNCTALGDYSLASGRNSTASADYSIAMGENCTASALNAVSIGTFNTSSGVASATFGGGNNASADFAFAEGTGTVASAAGAHAEGQVTQATAAGAHAEGGNTVASGVGSHAEGDASIASGWASHAEGNYSVANLDCSNATAAGRFNINGDAQRITTMLKVATTNNVADNMQDLSGADGITIPTDCSVKIKIEVIAVQTGGVAGTIGDTFSQEIKLTANNIAGVSAVVPTAAVTLANYSVVAGNVLYELPFNTAAFGGSVVASIAANKLQVTVIGENNKNIQWVAYVSMVWTGYRNFLL